MSYAKPIGERKKERKTEKRKKERLTERKKD